MSGELSSAITDSSDPVTTGPDSNLGTVTTPAPSASPAPSPQPSPATDLPRFHRTFGSTLKGILLGFGMGGVPGVIEGAIAPGRVQQTANDIQTTRHFESLKAAASVGLLAAQTREANVATEEHQEQLNIMHQSTALWAKRMGLDPTVQVSGTNPQEYDSSAQAAIPAVKAANGGLIPTVVGTNSTIGTGDDPKTHQTTVYAPGTPKSMDGIRGVIEPATATVPHMVAEFFRAQGRPVPSDSDWANLGVNPANSGPMNGMQAAAENQIAQRDAIQTAAQFFMTTPTLEGGGNAEQTAAKNNVVLQQVKNQLSTYKASGGQDPDTLRQLQTRIDTVENGIKEGVKAGTAAKIGDINATAPAEAQAAAGKAVAEAKATLPYKLTQARAEESLKDGDPNAAGQLLVSGDVAPSQIISSRKPAFAQAAFTAAKRLDPNWNSQQAEGYFKVAGSPTNVQFFGSAKSLTDKGGTLDQLQSAYNQLPNGQIPVLNKFADWKAAAEGSGATAGFAQTALGVADDYAKVMGGGQGSDTAREQVLTSFAASHSPQQMQSAINAARAAVNSQMTSRIGSNPVMRRMYGQGVPPAGATMKVPASDGRLHWSDGKTDLGPAE